MKCRFPEKARSGLPDAHLYLLVELHMDILESVDGTEMDSLKITLLDSCTAVVVS